VTTQIKPNYKGNDMTSKNNAAVAKTPEELAKMVVQLRDALEIVLDTPVGGPRSVQDWKKADAIGREAIQRSKDVVA
jgi:hypothetical protein